MLANSSTAFASLPTTYEILTRLDQFSELVDTWAGSLRQGGPSIVSEQITPHLRMLFPLCPHILLLSIKPDGGENSCP